jgi:hypothetical protein
MLSRAQKDELEQQGPQNIRFKLASYGGGRGAAIGGFRCGDFNRGEIEDWLAESTSGKRPNSAQPYAGDR